MPELPEVETIVRQLDRVLPGKVIGEVEVLREKSAVNELGVLVGREIVEVSRIAKNIVFELGGNSGWENGSQKAQKKEKGTEKMYLLVHLKMTGQLIFDQNDQAPSTKLQTNSKDKNPNNKTSRVVGGHPALRQGSGQAAGSSRVVGGHPTKDWIGQLPSKHTRIVASFDDGSRLYFNDMRVFGWWRVVSSYELRVMSHDLPPDVVDREFTVDYLREVLSRSGRAVKLVILDQKKMGGMGNIYANDALWIARIHPEKPANKLKKREVLELHKAMVEVLQKGIELGGASYSDFVDTEGLGGKYQEHFLVYDREGEECLRKGCGGVISKKKIGGRGTYFCPKCQV